MDLRRQAGPVYGAGQVTAQGFIDLHTNGLNVEEHPMQATIAAKHYQRQTPKGDRQ